ncbi:hypothetical protein AltI4_24170 [Alteromonas sp. I4]|nr:hypothetical protein AltI4_24170 [Alteromonas sp. I4]
MSEWPWAGRHVYLLGGIYAVNKPNSQIIEIFPHTLDRLNASIEMPSRIQLRSAPLSKLGSLA